MQAVAPAGAEVFAGHTLHCPPKRKVPEGHTPATVLMTHTPPTLPVPAGHAVHAAAVADVEYVFGVEHTVHAVCPPVVE